MPTNNKYEAATVETILKQLANGTPPEVIVEEMHVSKAAVDFCRLKVLGHSSEGKIPSFEDITNDRNQFDKMASDHIEDNRKALTKRLLISGFHPRQAKFFSHLSIHQCNRMMGELKKEIAIFKPIFPYPATPAARVVATVFLSHFVSMSEMKGMKNVDLSCFMHAWMVTFDQFRDIKSDFLEGFCPELLLPGTLFELAHGYYEDGDEDTPEEEIAAKKSRKVLRYSCPHCGTKYPVFLAHSDDDDNQDCPLCTFAARSAELDFTDRIMEKPRNDVRRRVKDLQA